MGGGGVVGSNCVRFGEKKVLMGRGISKENANRNVCETVLEGVEGVLIGGFGW